MAKRTVIFRVGSHVLIIFAAVLIPLCVQAEDRFSLRIWGSASPVISGEAGSGENPPDYSDVFDSGLGAGAEFGWSFSRSFSALVGAGYEVFDGGVHEPIEFGDLEVVPVYVGGMLHLNPGNPRWDLYLRADVGAARLSPVEVSFGPLTGEYWGASWVLLFDAGGGVEYRWGRWGASMEVKIRYLGEPDAALGDPSVAGSSWTAPVVAGLNYRF